MENLQNSTAFFNWLSGQHAVADPLLLSSHVVTPADTITLTGIQTALQKYSDCLTYQNGRVTTTNTNNATKRSQIQALQKTISDRTLDVQISQDRALLARHPNLSRSYYEGVISIGRPMGHFTVPVLTGISTFLLSLSFFMLLNLLRLDSRLVFSVPAFISHHVGSNGFGTPFWIMTGVSVILLGLTIYAFNK